MDLSDNYIRDFSPLSACIELVSLNLDRTNLTSLYSLRSLEKLSILFLRDCTGFGSADVLYQLPALKHLMIDPAIVERFGLGA